MTPIYSVKTRFSIWDASLLVVAIVMVLQGLTGGGILPIFTGVAVIAFLLFTRHGAYDVYLDTLVIRYRGPRTMVVPLKDVQSARIVSQPLGGPAILVRRARGGVLIITPKEPEVLLAHLEGKQGEAEAPASPASADPPRPRPRRPRGRRR